MANIRERLRAWRLRRGRPRTEAKKDWKTVGETPWPSEGLGHGSNVPPNYVPPADEGRPPH